MTTQTEDLYAQTDTQTEMCSLTVRLPQELRDSFGMLCASRKTEMSRVIRNFISREVKSATIIETK